MASEKVGTQWLISFEQNLLYLATKLIKTSFAKAGAKVIVEIETDNNSIERDPCCCGSYA